MIKKLYYQILVVVSLMAALLMVPAPAKAEDESTHKAKSGIFIRPSSGLDIKTDIDERKNASILSSKHLPLSDNIDIALNDNMGIGPVFGKPQKQDVPSKNQHSNDHRTLLGIIFHF
jgi:hypothetical protein